MENNKIKIVLVDDHDIVRDGINALLLFENDIEVIGEASNSDELYKLITHKSPDIILLDILMPGKTGIEVAEFLKAEYPNIKIIILSSNFDENSIFNSISAGVKGFLPKNVKKIELLEAIRQVNNDNEYYSDSISITIFKNFKNYAKASKKQVSMHSKSLSAREKEIVRCFAEGLSYKEIAEKLFITTSTVESHKVNIMQKLGIKTNVDIVKYAIRNGIIEL